MKWRGWTCRTSTPEPTRRDLKADGKARAVFTLAGGSADFPAVATDYHRPIGPLKDGKIDGESANGTEA